VDFMLPSDFGGGTGTVGYGTGGSNGTNGADSNGTNGSGGGAGNANIGLQGSGGVTNFETGKVSDVNGNGESASNGQAGSDSASGSNGQGGTSSASGDDAAGVANANTGDQVNVSLVRDATAEENGQVTVSVPEEVASSGRAFSFTLPSSIANGANKAKVRVTLKGGKRLPTWLNYIPATRTFVATAMPGGALPLDLTVAVGSRQTIVSVVERQAH
jgi:hypothetical protein